MKGFRFLFFVENMDENLSCKYGQKFFDYAKQSARDAAKQSATDALKTSSKKLKKQDK